MVSRWSLTCCQVFILNLLISSALVIEAEIADFPSAVNSPASWINNPSFDFGMLDAAGVIPILVNATFICGFHCTNLGGSCLFAVSIFQIIQNSSLHPQIVWSANRDKPVKFRATLQLSEEGALKLQDLDGTLVWTTETAGKSVSGLKLTVEGNLVLFDRNNEVVWQSFDHPTDSLVPGQHLLSEQRLTVSASTSNQSYSFGLINGNLVAYIGSDPQQAYFGPLAIQRRSEEGPCRAEYLNGRFGSFPTPSVSTMQFLQLGSDGHLRIYEWRGSKWEEIFDILTNYIGKCGYPLVCGQYGICSNGLCCCPKAANVEQDVYFEQIHDQHSNPSCSSRRPISCESSKHHDFIDLEGIDYFSSGPYVEQKSVANCKKSCLNNCSCRVSIFRQFRNSSRGHCLLLSEVFSFKKQAAYSKGFTSLAFVKVQNDPNESSNSPNAKRTKVVAILGSIFGALFILFLLIAVLILRAFRRQVEKVDKKRLRVRFKRFSYGGLMSMTGNFSRKLGEGGFGSVFEGTRPDGTKIAVKRLDGVRQVRDSFMAEVEALGNVYHVNLVTLIGFCAEKSHRLLVYEYKEKGSLDKWIFQRNQGFSLGWKLRKKVILDVAKGLAYLHEGCNQKILHLDIKPQNILLDESFKAELADFGLSKLIDREQTAQIMTAMRGTPGYMAPEWSSAVITEKVDVYSFGVVVLEILCGRRNVDRHQPEEEMHLLSLFKKKAEVGELADLVDKSNDDMQANREEVVKMMRVAAWCLQADCTKRPSMSGVLKVLEGFEDVRGNLNYEFLNPQATRGKAPISQKDVAVTIAMPSILSGPR